MNHTTPTLEHIVLDALREMGNIAAAHAATTLSKFLGRQVTIDVPSCELYSAATFPRVMKMGEQTVTAVFMEVAGTYPGIVLLVFPIDTAIGLARSFFSTDADRCGTDLDHCTGHDREALLEVGNICICAYLNAVSDFINATLLPMPPSIEVDHLGEVLHRQTSDLMRSARYVLVIKNRFLHSEGSFYGHLIFFPAEALQTLILERFGVAGADPAQLLSTA